MASPYREFVRKAKERFAANKIKKLLPRAGMEFTAHARYKMSQYGLSEQKVRSVLRNPRRTEKGIAPKTAAVMQPVTPKMIEGKEAWKQELWVMYIRKRKKGAGGILLPETTRIISAWRYPGISPKRSPIPEEIWQELASGSILEEE
ncbi:MAG: hypothetical protein KBA91_00935 [Candidatus Moranbacteria bacterium]|jgi:hypothetical protein|nr:hypothetical protein [Candidatus Moranbacteria bacterium]